MGKLCRVALTSQLSDAMPPLGAISVFPLGATSTLASRSIFSFAAVCPVGAIYTYSGKIELGVPDASDPLLRGLASIDFAGLNPGGCFWVARRHQV